MKQMNTEYIDVVRLDTEGAEYEVLQDWRKKGLIGKIGQLLMEAHWMTKKSETEFQRLRDLKCPPSPAASSFTAIPRMPGDTTTVDAGNMATASRALATKRRNSGALSQPTGHVTTENQQCFEFTPFVAMNHNDPTGGVWEMTLLHPRVGDDVVASSQSFSEEASSVGTFSAVETPGGARASERRRDGGSPLQEAPPRRYLTSSSSSCFDARKWYTQQVSPEQLEQARRQRDQPQTTQGDQDLVLDSLFAEHPVGIGARNREAVEFGFPDGADYGNSRPLVEGRHKFKRTLLLDGGPHASETNKKKIPELHQRIFFLLKCE